MEPCNTWGISSVGRASCWQREGHRFEPGMLHSPPPCVARGFLFDWERSHTETLRRRIRGRNLPTNGGRQSHMRETPAVPFIPWRSSFRMVLYIFLSAPRAPGALVRCQSRHLPAGCSPCSANPARSLCGSASASFDCSPLKKR